MLDKDQLGIVRGSVAALAVVVAAVGGGYIWVSPQWFGLTNGMAMSDQIAFGLKADLPLFLWLAFCVRVVSKRRFQSAVDRKGSAFGSPSEMIAVPLAVLQNSLEQTVLAFGGHLVLATVLRGPSSDHRRSSWQCVGSAPSRSSGRLPRLSFGRLALACIQFC
jgi:hypothetical protein